VVQHVIHLGSLSNMGKPVVEIATAAVATVNSARYEGVPT
jgi:hypothetical protein